MEVLTMAKKKGLYANIHAKRKRIKAGSGEKMRKPGAKGAPTAANFRRCQYDQTKEVNGQQQRIGTLKLDAPIGVLSEGIDTTIYKPIKDAGKSDDPFKKEIYDMIDESFVYLHVGQWGKGGYGEDRKNIAVMIK